MKRKTKLIIAVLIPAILAVLVLLAPGLLQLDRIRATLVDRLSQELNQDVQIAEVRWHWLPVPRLTLHEARLANKQYRLEARKITAYPEWVSLLKGEGRLGRLVLHEPQLLIEKLQAQSAPQDLPSTTVIIENGSAVMAAGLLPSLPTREIKFTELNGRLRLDAASITIDQLRSTASFCRSLELEGVFQPAEDRYELRFAALGLELDQGLASLAGGRITPVESVANLQGTLSGQGLEKMAAEVRGDLPCFLAVPAEEKILLSCGFGDFRLEKSGGNFELAVRRLELKDPAFELSGEISRTAGADEPPVWRLDLGAREIDATAVRQKLLAWLGEHELVQEVTDIVLGGEVREAAYFFEGPLADLKHLKNMRITADVARADLHIPDLDLELSEARGKIEILDAVLKGEGLRARMGESIGTDCTLALELTGEEHLLHLDLELEADLAALPEVLHKVAPNSPRFLKEVDRFSLVSGRAAGRLLVEGPLKHPRAEITVASATASARYDRLPWLLEIRSGRATILPDRQIEWQEITGSAGPHQIESSSGSVNWAETMALDLRETAARLETADFFQVLLGFETIRREIEPVLSEISGSLEVRHGSLKGPVQAPENWVYSLEAATSGLAWRSPLLSGPVRTGAAAALIDQDRILLQRSTNLVFGSDWRLRGRLEHHRLSDWRGRLTLTGTALEEAAAWVREQDWVPPRTFFPRIPARLQEFTVSWQPRSWEMNGTLLAGTGPAGPKAELDIRSTPAGIAVRRLQVSADGEQASVTFEPTGPEAWQLAWQGVLRGPTMDALLEEGSLLEGFLQGNFTLHRLSSRPGAVRLDGSLEAAGLNLSNLRPWLPTIREARLAGTRNHLLLKSTVLELEGEQVAASGMVDLVEHGLALDLRLSAEALAWESLTPMLEGIRVWRRQGPETNSGTAAWEVSGEADFEVEAFSYRTDGGPEGRAAVLTWKPLAGSLLLNPPDGFRVQITSAELCGLLMSGGYSSDPSLGESFLRLQTRADQLPSFEEVLPCLGVEQALIVGRFTLDTLLFGTPGNWSRGTVKLHSEDGNIRRLTLLSRIFSVVNLTDLFVQNGGENPVAGGLSYSELEINGRVSDNIFTMEKAVVRGEGLNLFARGDLDLAEFQTDLTILIAPFKTIDAIISRVPIIGRVVGGANATLVTVPVGVKGPLDDPRITLLPPEAIGEGILSLVKDTLSIPFFILDPLLPERGEEREKGGERSEEE